MSSPPVCTTQVILVLCCSAVRPVFSVKVAKVQCLHIHQLVKIPVVSAMPCCSRASCTYFVERSSSVVECRTRNRESPGSNPPLLPFRRLGIFRSLHRRPCSLSCINEYLAIDSGGNVSDLVLAHNCCLARMLPGEAENGVGMNRSVREGKKCEAL